MGTSISGATEAAIRTPRVKFRYREMAESNEQTEVPCGGCTQCCRSGQGLLLHPEQGDEVQSYQVQVRKDAASGAFVYLLDTNEKGECVYLGPSGCTIYNRRPLLCRSFDCRKHYLILPKQDRDNLVRLGLSSRAVFNEARRRLKTLSAAERKECLDKREELFS
jgi:Fe-S-cluster containining protein